VLIETDALARVWMVDIQDKWPVIEHSRRRETGILRRS